MKFTVILMKEISKRCANAVIVSNPDMADYFVRFETTGILSRPGMAVFNRSGDMVFVDTSLNYINEVKHLCRMPPFTEALEKSKKKREH